MVGSKPHLYWDSCVFISLLTGQNRTEEEMAILYAIQAMVDDGKAIISTSAITIVEVLDCHLTTEQQNLFKGLIGNPNTPFIQLDTKIADKAQIIRSYYNDKQKIEAPDAIHLATAEHIEAEAFHTYDGCSTRKRPGDLLRLTQPIAEKYQLKICKPEIPALEEMPPLIAEAQKTKG